ncbi:uncharacterized protein BDZ83DRAFT_26907 [Colletotrichum acutatum]|uniref:Zn(2)-C6 fungal-type domain-containing protein n=1 Tax=Glomerella acutata TaxID=27357 RepID=A0AAD8XES2_GLOAC|nr:uncharacterized protein BDZ83DRAFT_26907 [Colletotrichum acutatum]KAK1717513.1 hypothetical protein BDZ83DRAFT_26907 [Colletotrichum acutatum]
MRSAAGAFDPTPHMGARIPSFPLFSSCSPSKIYPTAYAHRTRKVTRILQPQLRKSTSGGVTATVTATGAALLLHKIRRKRNPRAPFPSFLVAPGPRPHPAAKVVLSFRTIYGRLLSRDPVLVRAPNSPSPGAQRLAWHLDNSRFRISSFPPRRTPLRGSWTLAARVRPTLKVKLIWSKLEISRRVAMDTGSSAGVGAGLSAAGGVGGANLPIKRACDACRARKVRCLILHWPMSSCHSTPSIGRRADYVLVRFAVIEKNHVLTASTPASSVRIHRGSSPKRREPASSSPLNMRRRST